ncbi:hypothetical protein [Galactobacter valiniphilus]|uniref:hypothetical protein n=1 Tax=Galactobacter valiniphilus TaxID=2676122 RepID=UPI003735063C
MTGPQDHDDARPAGQDPVRPHEELPADEAATEAAELAELAESIEDALEPEVEERLDEAKAWEPTAWEPHAPTTVGEAPAEEHSILDEDPTVSIPSVAEVIDAAEDREPTAADALHDGADAPSSPAPAPAGPAAWQDRFAAANAEAPEAAGEDDEDPEDTAIRDRGAWASAAVTGVASVGGTAAASDLPAAPAADQDPQPATQALPPIAAPAEEPATQAMDVAPPAATPEAAAAPHEPTQAELAAAFPSTPFGLVSPGAKQPTSGIHALAAPAGPGGPGETDLDATMLHAPLLPPTPQPQAPIPGYGETPAGTPAMRPRGAERRAPEKKKTPVWAILVGALIGAALIVGIVLLAWQPWDKTPTADPSTGPSQSQPTQNTAPGEVADGSPAAAVRDLGEALAKGDATTALGLLDESLTAPARDVDNALLSNEAYAAAKNRPTAIKIDPASTAAVAEDTTSARVTAVVTQNGKDVPTTFQVRRSTTTGPWFVDPSTLPTIRVSNASGTTIKVNGADVKVPGTAGDYSTTRFRVLPGSYAVEGKADAFTSFAKAETLNAPITALGTEGSANAGSVSLKPKRTDQFKTAATKAVDAWLDKCAASKDMKPSGCPFSGPTTFEGAKVTDVKWSIDQRPTLSFHDYGIGAETVSGSGGTASVSGKAKVDGEDRSVSGKVSGFSFRGTLTVKGKDITFAPAS